MVVKFFGNKKGGSSKAIDYLLNEREAEGTAKVLQGDPSITRELINSISFKQKVTVGCLSFEEKNINQEQKYKLMEDFENHLLPGMQDRYNILWVEHRDKGRLELNFVIPKIDLKTQKSLNPYYHKADLPRVEKWQDIQNLEHGYSNPKDPSKARTIETHSIKHINADYEQLDKLLHNLVSEGTIKNRDHLKELLKENGYQITRSGKDYISIKTPESKRAKKFKGSIYNERFTSLEELRTISKERSQAIREYSKRDTQRELTRLKSELREYTHDKFTKLEQQFKKREYREHKRDREASPKQSENDRRKYEERQKINTISNSNNFSINRDNGNDLYKTLSDTERGSNSRSTNGNKSGEIQSISQLLQELEKQSGESKERNKTAPSNENSEQRIDKNIEKMASTSDYAENRQRGDLYQTTSKQDISRRENTVQMGTNKGIDNDSTRTTVNGRIRTREATQYRDYRKARQSRTTVYKSLGADNTELQERARQIREQQQQIVEQSESHLQQVGNIEPTIGRYARLKERASSYIKSARSYLKEKYNSYVDKFESLKHKLNSSQEFFTSKYKQVKEQGKELSFNDVKKASGAFTANKTHDLMETAKEVKEREVIQKLEAKAKEIKRKNKPSHNYGLSMRR